MSKQVIAVDLDDVLSNSAASFIAFGNERWGLNLTLEDYSEHLSEMWKVEEHEAEKRILEFHNSGVTTDYSPDTVASAVLAELAKKYELVITTSRRREIEPLTRQWLEKHYGGIFTDVRFAGIWDVEGGKAERMHMTKATLCQEIGASYLIDDQPKHCKGAADSGLIGIVFGEYPWNSDVKPSKGIVRAKDWEQVLEFFNGQA